VEGCLGQFLPGQAEEFGRGEIGFDDKIFFIEREVAGGCEVEETEVARAFGVERGLQTAQFLVLHLQFDLVDEQLVHRLGGVGPGGHGWGHLGHYDFGLATEVGRGIVRGFAHGVPWWKCSVVAMA